ncbi:hypothetical protein ID866_7874 [Astraeus odoratus]|nr:hypothetical protein ID866_7874 [Astraeus odoratus]
MIMDPANIRAHFERIGYFRILVIGRANSGKTALLQRVCNAIDLPEVFDGRGNKVWDIFIILSSSQCGYHDINNELVFRSNPHFIFYDSCGFESGSVEELEVVETFVTDRSRTRKLENRIHAIWYCIPANDHARLVTAAEEKFFNEFNTGCVPVIALLTKCDQLKGVAINELRCSGKSLKEAIHLAGDVEMQLLHGLEDRLKESLGSCKFPPKCYLTLANMHNENSDCTNLLSATVNALDTESLQMLLISTQQENILSNIKWAVEK